MSFEDVKRIIKQRKEKAESDLAACPRGANHGRVNELNALLAEIEEAEKGEKI